jgi:hypothetical protein
LGYQSQQTKTNTLKSQLLLTPTILVGALDVSIGYNGVLVGPVNNAGVVTISSGSTLVIL